MPELTLVAEGIDVPLYISICPPFNDSKYDEGAEEDLNLHSSAREVAASTTRPRRDCLMVWGKIVVSFIVVLLGTRPSEGSGFTTSCATACDANAM